MSTALATTTTPPAKKPLELEVGDLVFYTGKVTEYTQFKHRIIYRCIEKKYSGEGENSYLSYKYVAAFDFENPLGVGLASIGGFSNISDFKKLSLLDVCTLRLHFDNFIREWAKDMGKADPDDVR